ncbi:MAG: type II CAAX endopeptidase family protein [Deltaproteobacteria bacterium]|jgi:membrane protease YdiL (CAAX protease family)|nr:type II CAAX endopeptidase family protein [Deltaproteobacteria bacterium]
MMPKLNLKKIILFFCGFILFLSILHRILSFSPFLFAYISLVFAVIFLLTPELVLARLTPENQDKPQIKLWQHSLLKSIIWGVATSVILLGAYWLLHYFWFKYSCPGNSGFSLGRNCSNYHSTFTYPFSLLKSLDLLAFQLIIVAFPEEFFYRGFLQPLLYKSTQLQRFTGFKKIGAAIFLQALLFAVGHFLIDFNPMRLSVFFPALFFGFIAWKSKSILAPIIFHTAANYISLLLENGFFN